MLFDLKADPQEIDDLGTSPDHGEVIDLMYDRLAKWARRPSQRTTLSDAAILAQRGKGRRKGVVPDLFDGTEVEEEVLARYRGRAGQSYLEPS